MQFGSINDRDVQNVCEFRENRYSDTDTLKGGMNLCGFVWFLFKFRRPVKHVLLYCCKLCKGGSRERRAVGAV